MRYAILMLLMLATTPANSQDRITMEMINFITEHTGLEYNGEQLPEVHRHTQQQMCSVLYEGNPPDPCTVAGYYNDETNEIFISKTPTQHMVADRYHEVVLVHELTHYMQRINGVYETIRCRRALERDAWMIQDRWVIEHQIDEQQRPDALWAIVMSSCPSDMPMLDVQSQ
mgnify:CR=1 FL=1